MYHSAEARAHDCDAQEGSKVPSCASQSNAALRDIPRQWPAALRHIVHGPDTNLVPSRGTKAHMFFLIGLYM